MLTAPRSTVPTFAFVCVVGVLSGCKAEAPAAAQPQTPSSQAAPSAAGCGPVDALAQMDGRKPVPLQPMMAWHQKQNMMAHLVSVQKIVGAVAREDWAGVAKASSMIESSPQMQQMCEHMGAGADGFTDLALDFHHRADAIAKAAETKDAAAVLKATEHTLEACTHCHATYRQEVLSAEAWQARTGSEHQPAMMHGDGQH